MKKNASYMAEIFNFSDFGKEEKEEETNLQKFQFKIFDWKIKK